MSASLRSSGPTPAAAASAAFFNASNHEYFQIPPISSLFDSQLGYRVVQNTSIFEVGMTLAFWVRFASSAGSGQTLVELSNGVSTENIYVRRVGSTAELLFGVSHSMSSVRREYATVNGTILPATWQHISWTILPIFSSSTTFDAAWNIFIDAGFAAAYTNLPGVMPIDGTYSVNYIGNTPLQQSSFFMGWIDDLRLYERALTLQSIRAIYAMDPCCHAASGSFIDMTKSCATGKDTFDPRFCKPCRTDCGPMQYIADYNSRCTGRSTQDTTTCLPCRKCGTDQFIGQICSGTTLFDEQICYPCRYKSSSDCPRPDTQVLIGRCDGSDEYDTSVCMTCAAGCVGYTEDPQVSYIVC